MIYVASSWANTYQPSVVLALRAEGYAVYDFRNPAPGVPGFSWEEIDTNWRAWTPAQYRDAVVFSKAARDGFHRDRVALVASRLCVLVLPCGASAHLEAGFAVGRGIPLMIYLPDSAPWKPELMYRFGTVVLSEVELLRAARLVQGISRA
jgi:hypothetical protein